MKPSAYLSEQNWPECVPWMGPVRKGGPKPWARPIHDDTGLDTYPPHHIAAASISYEHSGDVCPWCGVPLRDNQTVRTADGDSGTIWELAHDDISVPLYHEPCYQLRQAKIHSQRHTSLGEFIE